MVNMGAPDAKSEDDIQGGSFAKPGTYHAIVKDAIEEEYTNAAGDCKERVVLTFEVLAGSPIGQEGATVKEKFYISPGAMPRINRLGLVLGLIAPGAKDTSIDIALAVGRQLVIEVEEETYTDSRTGQERKKSNVAYMGFWSVNNKEVADLPKDQEALKLAVTGLPTAPPEGQAATGSDDDAKWEDVG